MLQKNGKVKTFFEFFVNLIKKEGVFYFMDQYEKILQQLMGGEISSYTIKKEEFLKFREVLLKHENYKHFRGEAQQGGDIIYTYLAEKRA